MNIVVCLRPIGPDPRSHLANAEPLALAMKVASQHQVIALLPDSAGALQPLQQALDAGAARAVRLLDEQLSPSDFHTLGHLLSNAIRRLGGDLVLIGTPYDDEGVGAMSASLAKQLGTLHLARVEDLGLGGQQTVEITVRGSGRKRRLALAPPAVLSVVGAPGVALPAPTPPPARTIAAPAIETISLTDPDATVVRRRTEHLGRPEMAARPLHTVASAEDLLRRLGETTPR